MGLTGKKGVLALLHFTQDYSHVVHTVKKDQCLSCAVGRVLFPGLVGIKRNLLSEPPLLKWLRGTKHTNLTPF